MYVEAPEIKRCCCCLPSRYGILLWVYIKIGLSIMALFPFMYMVMIFVVFRVRSTDFFFILLAVLVLMVDIIMGIVALVGGHLKKVKLLEAYYKYSIISGVVFFFIYLAILTLMFYSCDFYQSHNLRYLHFIASVVATGFATIAVQVYMLFVLRSKLQKLGNRCEFRFVNNAAEAECSMDLEWNWQETATEHNQNGITKDPPSETDSKSPIFEEHIEEEVKLYKYNKINKATDL